MHEPHGQSARRWWNLPIFMCGLPWHPFVAEVSSIMIIIEIHELLFMVSDSDWVTMRTFERIPFSCTGDSPRIAMRSRLQILHPFRRIDLTFRSCALSTGLCRYATVFFFERYQGCRDTNVNVDVDATDRPRHLPHDAHTSVRSSRRPVNQNFVVELVVEKGETYQEHSGNDVTSTWRPWLHVEWVT